MPRSSFLPEIENGLRNMPEGDVFAFRLRLVSAMIAGVSLAGHDRPLSHPVHLFMLCFASTSAATGYHYLMGMQAPYPWYDLPVLFGTAGGIGLIVGPVGLLAEKWRRDPELREGTPLGMDVAFLLMLLLTSVTGLALLALRATPAMGLLLALHLGIVFALFVTMPYGKFVHGIYRFLALVRAAKDRHHEFARDKG